MTTLVMPARALAADQETAGEPQDRAALIDLNNATAEELESLPGIGPSKAKAIMDYRQRRPFRTVAELVRIKGFGHKTVRRLAPLLTVDGAAPRPPEPSAPRKPCPGQG